MKAKTRFTFSGARFAVAIGGLTVSLQLSAFAQHSIDGTLSTEAAAQAQAGSTPSVAPFWSISAIQAPGAPLSSIEQTNGIVRGFLPLSALGFVLDQTMAVAPNVAAVIWLQVPFLYQTNATHTSTLSLPSGSKFYRLRKP